MTRTTDPSGKPLALKRRPIDPNQDLDLADRPGEVWRPVPGHEGAYEVSSLGRVKSVERLVPSNPGNTRTQHARILKLLENAAKGDYLQCSLAGRTMKPHRLVLEAFVGPRPDGLVTRHLNGCAKDNRLSNLQYGTQKQNVQDTKDHGRFWPDSITHCRRGHLLEGHNLLRTNGRHCRACAYAGNELGPGLRDTPEFKALADEAYASIQSGEYDRPRTHCQRGHELRTPNLVPSQERKGRRRCLSCQRALTSFWRRPEDKTPEAIQTASDQYFEEIAGDTQPPLTRKHGGPSRNLVKGRRLDRTPPGLPQSWASSEASRRTMLGNRSSDTAPELALRRELRALGLTGYRLRWPVPSMPRRSIDIAFVKSRVAVLVDGCFWHGCPEHGSAPRSNRDYWRTKLERNVERDAETNAALESAGWTVLRFWTHQSPGEAASEVLRQIEEKTRP